ncbi:MAG TPA: hypothetical protein PK079_07960 [Leptospiraceae bacterium]|nr:hypothetical protein [Leptospiraceae bacterium]HMX34244.1 hypothetical protein [Leptospiraceae bacterium]HMY32443.1 hypothetical protein [Leptospiraceae bacterium]HMZ64198.1 hypothetical protein [Leptospiraceae bacterium]HNA08450.1 hypothetical protein [Leptospiraceae bacterium]
MSKLFSEEELEQIKSAVKDAEKTTSAEIVPVFYESCGLYPDTYWKSGIFFAAAYSFCYLFYTKLTNTWGDSLSKFFVMQMTSGLIGVAAVYLIPAWKRLLTDKMFVKQRVRDVAYRVFLEESVFNTKTRTGMLLFISFFEKEALILGDEGINQKVTPDVWEGILSQLIQGMKSGEKTNSIIAAIRSMGNLLKQYPIDAKDTNELRDDLRLGDTK